MITRQRHRQDWIQGARRAAFGVLVLEMAVGVLLVAQTVVYVGFNYGTLNRLVALPTNARVEELRAALRPVVQPLRELEAAQAGVSLAPGERLMRCELESEAFLFAVVDEEGRVRSWWVEIGVCRYGSRPPKAMRKDDNGAERR